MDSVTLAVAAAAVAAAGNIVATVLLWARDRDRTREATSARQAMSTVVSTLRDRNRILEYQAALAGGTTQRTALETEPYLTDLVHKVRDRDQPITLTEDGQPSAVLLSVETLQGLEETIDILSDRETMRRLAESDAELERGEIVSAEDLASAMQARKLSSQ